MVQNGFNNHVSYLTFVISKLSMWLSGLMAVRMLGTERSDSEVFSQWAATLVNINFEKGPRVLKAYSLYLGVPHL